MIVQRTESGSAEIVDVEAVNETVDEKSGLGRIVTL